MTGYAYKIALENCILYAKITLADQKTADYSKDVTDNTEMFIEILEQEYAQAIKREEEEKRLVELLEQEYAPAIKREEEE